MHVFKHIFIWAVLVCCALGTFILFCCGLGTLILFFLVNNKIEILGQNINQSTRQEIFLSFNETVSQSLFHSVILSATKLLSTS